MPLLLSIVLAAALPESLRRMVAAHFSPRRIIKIVRKLAPDLKVNERTAFSVGGEKSTGFPLLVIFERRRAIGTLLIWITFFIDLGVFYALQSWLPTILTNSGYSIGNVATVTGLTTTGGILAVFVVGPLMDRWKSLCDGSKPVFWWLSVDRFPGGGADMVAAAIDADCFRRRCLRQRWTKEQHRIVRHVLSARRPLDRSGLGPRRQPLGRIFGPLSFGWLLNQGWSPATVFLAGGAPLLIAGAAIFVMGRIYHCE